MVFNPEKCSFHTTMLALANYQAVMPFRRMPERAPKRMSEQQAMGAALRALRRRADLTQEAAAEAASVVVQSWRRYEAGERELSPDKASKLAQAVGATLSELAQEKERILSGGAPRFGTEAPRSFSPTIQSQPQHLIIRDRVQAGAWLLADDFDQGAPRTYPVAPDPRYPHAKQWLSEAVGDSMNSIEGPGRGIWEGDLVHVVDATDIGYYPTHGHLVEVERLRFDGAERELTIKQLEVTADGAKLWPRSSNPRWSEPLDLAAGAQEGEDFEVRIRGLVLSITRRISY